MSTFETVLMMLLVADALALTGLVLLQQGRGADVGAAFGSGSSNTMFGSAGSAPFLTKLTVWLAIGFFVISFGLAYTAKERAASLGMIGIPSVGGVRGVGEVEVIEGVEPAGGVEFVEEILTPETESVDSDIPDV